MVNITCVWPLVWMARFDYGTVTLDVCEDIASGLNGSISFIPVSRMAEGFPLTLSKLTFSNQPNGGDDNAYLHNLTKQEVIDAPTDLMGNILLGIHGNPSREPPTLAEVASAIPPIRSIKDARLWTATRGSGRDATFDESMANMASGTPSPAQAASVLPGLASTQFDYEGLLGGTLPVLLVGFPVKTQQAAGVQAASGHWRVGGDGHLEDAEGLSGGEGRVRRDSIPEPVETEALKEEAVDGFWEMSVVRCKRAACTFPRALTSIASPAAHALAAPHTSTCQPCHPLPAPASPCQPHPRSHPTPVRATSGAPGQRNGLRAAGVHPIPTGQRVGSCRAVAAGDALL